MTDHLRHLATFVDEPEPGQFYWVLIESTEDSADWLTIASSDSHFDSWQEAWSAGNLVLRGLVQNPATGPRGLGASEDGDPVG